MHPLVDSECNISCPCSDDCCSHAGRHAIEELACYPEDEEEPLADKDWNISVVTILVHMLPTPARAPPNICPTDLVKGACSKLTFAGVFKPP